jgi:hypothetical protein
MLYIIKSKKTLLCFSDYQKALATAKVLQVGMLFIIQDLKIKQTVIL